jgi:hypothetical protein
MVPEENSSLTPQFMENSPTKLVPDAKKIRDRCVEESLQYPGAHFYHVYYSPCSNEL